MTASSGSGNRPEAEPFAGLRSRLSFVFRPGNRAVLQLVLGTETHDTSDRKALLGLLLAAGAVGGLAAAASPRRPTPAQQLHSLVLGQLRRAAALLDMKRVPPLVATPAVPNAASDGVRIYYNPSWVQQVLNAHCNDCECRITVVLGVMAHELGHHVNGDARRLDRLPHDKELIADFLAGFALARAGVSAEDFGRVLYEISGYGCCTHPAR